MKREIATASSHRVIVVGDNRIMAGPVATPLRNTLRAPFTRRTWAELAYTLATLPLAFIAVAYTVPMLENGLFFLCSPPGNINGRQNGCQPQLSS